METIFTKKKIEQTKMTTEELKNSIVKLETKHKQKYYWLQGLDRKTLLELFYYLIMLDTGTPVKNSYYF
jgi:hypothetical protein